jgi:uncharacterized protein YbbC (DUF1343 family)
LLTAAIYFVLLFTSLYPTLKIKKWSDTTVTSLILPVDRLAECWPSDLLHKKVGALLHPASVGSNLEHVSQKLVQLHQEILQLTAFLGPQHGILGHTQDNMIEWEGGADPLTGVPVFSLYGKHRKPTPQMMAHFDVLLVDLQDVGARYYTFIWSLYLCMQAAEELGKTVVVCDRPNPIGNAVEGPVLDLEYASFVGLHSIPVRHGQTIGQLAMQFKQECFPQLDLRVLPMQNWDAQHYFDQTGLPWVLPSPNMPTLDTAIVYPGMCLFEATNVSEGRGTTRPFELFGAPFINAPAMCEYLNGLQLPGVYFRESYFQPTFHKWVGQICNGAQIYVTNRAQFKPFAMAIEILKYLFHRYDQEFKWRTEPYEYETEKLAIDILLGSREYRLQHIEQV